MPSDVSGEYVALLEKALTGSLSPVRVWRMDGTSKFRAALMHPLQRMLERYDMALVKVTPPTAFGGYYESVSLIAPARLDNVRVCVEDVLQRGIPGDLMEAGVWRGGTPIFMRGLLRAHNVTDRLVWVADSFEGLPKPNAARYPADSGDAHHTLKWAAVSQEEVMTNFTRFGLLDEQVRFLRGWFSETLSSAPIEQLAVLRVDADMYESTMDTLASLYPKVSFGGYLIIDDYGAKPNCREAVDTYRRVEAITEPMIAIDESAVFWQKSPPLQKGRQGREVSTVR